MTSIAALNRVQGLINFKGLRRTLCTTQRAMAEQQHMGSDTAPQESKQAARKAIKAGLLKMPQDQMEAESAAIARHVLDAPFFSNSQNLGIYVHCARLREVDTSALLQSAMASGKRCYVPVVEDKESNMKLLHLDALSSLVSVPPFGILEPPSTYASGEPRVDVLQDGAPLDVLLLPGLGFDTSGNRLGRGGGYYDKALERLMQRAQDLGREPPLLVGLAYSCQVVPEVPVDKHDKKVDVLVTAAGVITFTNKSAGN
uniref:5-formyltetrahydrofolate cyclo-ligase n=2 Tax=Dunaliella tertiolecta TaxID=3047 RepID=A0A7S3QMX2_DUNTE